MELTRDELLQRLKISARELDEWLDNQLIAPVVGRSDLFPNPPWRKGSSTKILLAGLCPCGNPENQTQRRSARSRTSRDISSRGAISSPSASWPTGSGINVRTIKFWEEKGLIAPHRRTEGGFRLYRPGDVVLLSFIKDLQTFNYTLAEIGNILHLAGPDLGVTDADFADMPLAEMEKAGGALEFLIERMREVRDASSRVETIFTRRLRAVTRILRARKRG